MSKITSLAQRSLPLIVTILGLTCLVFPVAVHTDTVRVVPGNLERQIRVYMVLFNTPLNYLFPIDGERVVAGARMELMFWLQLVLGWFYRVLVKRISYRRVLVYASITTAIAIAVVLLGELCFRLVRMGFSPRAGLFALAATTACEVLAYGPHIAKSMGFYDAMVRAPLTTQDGEHLEGEGSRQGEGDKLGS